MELKLQLVVGCPVDVVTEPGISWRATSALNCWRLSSHYRCFTYLLLNKLEQCERLRRMNSSSLCTPLACDSPIVTNSFVGFDCFLFVSTYVWFLLLSFPDAPLPPFTQHSLGRAKLVRNPGKGSGPSWGQSVDCFLLRFVACRMWAWSYQHCYPRDGNGI